MVGLVEVIVEQGFLLQSVGDALQIMQVHELELCESSRLMINLTFACLPVGGRKEGGGRTGAMHAWQARGASRSG